MNVLQVAGGLAAVGISYVLLPAWWAEVDEHRKPREVYCPDAGRVVHLTTIAWRGAAACVGLPVRPSVRSCALWPERSGCARACLGSR